MMAADIGHIKNKAVAAATASALMFVNVCIVYANKLHMFYEMTFLSNVFVGALLLFAAVKIMLTGRDVPHFLYLSGAALLLTIIGICAVYAPHACFSNRSALLHLADPIIMTAFYLLFCDAREGRAYGIAAALIFPCAYYVFMILFGRATGKSVYIYFDTTAMSASYLVAMGIIAAAGFAASAALLFCVNRLIHAQAEKSRARRSARGANNGHIKA